MDSNHFLINFSSVGYQFYAGNSARTYQDRKSMDSILEDLSSLVQNKVMKTSKQSTLSILKHALKVNDTEEGI